MYQKVVRSSPFSTFFTKSSCVPAPPSTLMTAFSPIGVKSSFVSAAVARVWIKDCKVPSLNQFTRLIAWPLSKTDENGELTAVATKLAAGNCV